MPIPVHLYTRASHDALQAFLRSKPDDAHWAMISEGLFAPLAEQAGLETHAISGCACCVGNLALNVTLARLLRRVRPACIVVVVANPEHLPRMRALLQSAQYDGHLALTSADHA